ncbi:MAG: hypothetical protein ACE5FA_01530, partial [Dehalococcoidia bacterium]
ALVVVGIGLFVLSMAWAATRAAGNDQPQASSVCPTSLPLVSPGNGDTAQFLMDNTTGEWLWHVRFADGAQYRLDLNVDLATCSDAEVKDRIISARERTWIMHANQCQRDRSYLSGWMPPKPSDPELAWIYEKVYHRSDASRIDAARVESQCADVPADFQPSVYLTVPPGFDVPISRDH